MRRPIAGILALTVLSSTWLLADGAGAARKKRPVHKAAKPTVSQQLQQMKEMLSQQEQRNNQQEQRINQLQQQLEQAQQQLQSNAQQSAAAQQAAASAQQAAASAQQSANILNSSVADLKTNTANITQTLQTTQKSVKDLENPLAIHYKGITLTPVGWINGDFAYFNRNQNSDIIQSLSGVTLNNNTNDDLHTFRASARNSRVGMLAEAQLTPMTKATAYWEGDWSTTAAGPSSLQTNNYLFRQRQLFGQIDRKDGWTITTGQSWSLFTPSRQGIATRREWVPINLEENIVVGYHYKRQAGARITKNFDNKVWAAFSVENAEQSFTTNNFPTSVLGLNISTNAVSPSGYIVPQFSGTNASGATVSNISFGTNADVAPDLIAKIAFEPGWGHYEVAGLGRFFRDRYQTALATAPRAGVSNTSLGGGVAIAAILPLTKKIDFVTTGQVGAGTGSYNTSGSNDTTLNSNLKLVPIKTVAGVVGLEIHPTAKLDLYGYAGDEYYQRAQYTCTNASCGTQLGKPIGYGNVGYAPGSNNRDLAQASVGYTYRFYRGTYGTIQQSLNFNYYWRATWAGTATAATPSTLKGYNDTAYLQVRYVLP